MTGLALGLYYLTMVAVGAALVAAVVSPWFVRARPFGLSAVAVALASATVFLAMRWAAVGHPPLFGTFENTYAATWCLLAFGLFAAFRLPTMRDSWRIAAFWSAVFMAWGTRFRSTPVPLTISEQSIWVDVHVIFAWAAFVPLLVAGSMAVVDLIRGRRQPLSEQGRRNLNVLLTVGFVAFTAMLASGSWYLNVLFGTLWQWGIVETLCLLAWLVYAIVIHGVLFRRWSGAKLLLPLALMIPVLLAAYWVWSVFPGTFHFFDVPLVRPY